MTDLPSNLPKLLRDAGLKVIEVPGWRGFGRPASTGGFHPRGVLWHHTGSKDSNPNSIKDDLEYAKWLAEIGRSDLPAPLCQLSVGRDGTVYVCADGRGNHAGKAKASGPVPAGDGNELYAGVECQNSGSEGWSKAQYRSMVTLGAVLSDKVIHCTANANRAHKETSVTGKWDPGLLDMDKFRDDIGEAMKPKPKPKLNTVEKWRAAVDKANRDFPIPVSRTEAKRMQDNVKNELQDGPKS
jgi:hypothetical protein